MFNFSARSKGMVEYELSSKRWKYAVSILMSQEKIMKSDYCHLETWMFRQKAHVWLSGSTHQPDEP